MGSWFCRDSVFVCLLLPENMIICDKCLSKCGKRAKLNDLSFYYILHFYNILRFTGRMQDVIKINAKCSKLFQHGICWRSGLKLWNTIWKCFL